MPRSTCRRRLNGRLQVSECEVHEAGGREHLEYWIPAEELPAFNAALVGEIEVIAEFP
jgi:hypothetical protein